MFAIPRRLLRTTTLLTLSATLLACQAQAADESQTVKKLFSQKFPQREVVQVQASPVSGVYEVVLAGRQVVYTDAKVAHMFVGELIDIEGRVSLTEERVAELSRVDWKTLPLQHAIQDKRGNGQRKIAVFSDPDCPFCKKLEKEGLAKLDNVTIYTFLYPLEQLHPDAMRKSAQIWCSKDKLQAWAQTMRNNQATSGSGDCKTPLAEIQALGQKLGIQGTPALTFESGKLVAGAIPAEDIEKLLSQKK